MSIGFCTDLDVDLSLECEDTETCIMEECSNEAVMVADLTVTCGCQHSLCLHHYGIEKGRWQIFDELVCYFCRTLESLGLFLGWHKI